MPQPITPDDLKQVTDFPSLAKLFHEKLDWPDETWKSLARVQDLYGIPNDQIQGVNRLEAIARLSEDQTWAIFLVDFGTNEMKRSELRAILNKVAERARHEHAERTWPHDDILFICKHKDGFTFCHFRGNKLANAKLHTFGWRNPNRARTVIERNLPKLNWNHQANWAEAWDYKALTMEFFAEYKRVFESVEAKVIGLQGADKRRFTQSLFNRLLFLCFLQEKQWLKLGEDPREYLFTLHESYRPTKEEPRFYDRLKLLFFSGLNSANGNGGKTELELRIGKVPFLNGGLFESDPVLDGITVTVPDEAFNEIFAFLRRYTFTVTESTPLDVDVELDPEMLGKIFEELVTGRHESGSYYTPRPVVSFMCKEALKGYLGGYEKLVDEHDLEDIKVTDAKILIEKLESIKVCDPACGSGAYLVGMLQEIHALQNLLDTRRSESKDPEERKEAARNDYARKLKIIQNCLYGVDKDPFAVNIAWLRLWLSLVIDDERNPFTDDVSLPNLDVKVEVGDALLAPAPSDVLAGAQLSAVSELIRAYRTVKGEYMRAHTPADKANRKSVMLQLRSEIEIELRGDRELAEKQLAEANIQMQNAKTGKERTLAKVSLRRAEQTMDKLKEQPPVGALDWAVEFVEVFIDEHGNQSGFDVILANPPYVRKEEIPEGIKPFLARLYPDAITGRSDLYCSFYARGMQLLRQGGYHVFVCSSAWLDASYGANLQAYLLRHGHVKMVIDSAVEKQFSTANVNTIISVIEKCEPKNDQQTSFVLLLADFETAWSSSTLRRARQIGRDELLRLGSVNGMYVGGKWGGVMLRGPEVYWRLLERASNLTYLADVVEVLGYIHDNNTGPRFSPARVLWSVKDTSRLIVSEHSEGVITTGVSTNGNSRTFAPILFPRTFGSRHAVIYCQGGVLGKEFYRLIPRDGFNPLAIAAQLNSTLGILQRELLGIRGFGGGALKFAAEDVKRFALVRLKDDSALIKAFEDMSLRPTLPIDEELLQADRRKLDDLLFDAVGITSKDRSAVYIAVGELVHQREARSKSTSQRRTV